MTDGHTLTIERAYQAPARRVFDAFTSVEVMRRWWHPAPDWDTPEASVDLRVGGRLRVVMRDPDTDRRYGGGGEYTEIDPPNRLVFTWIWDDDRDQVRQLIEIEFEEQDGRHDRPLHARQPVGRGSGHLASRGLGRGVRQPRSDGRAVKPG